jgi:hypothetical protein
LLDHPFDDAEALQHVERWRMKCGRAQIARQISTCLNKRNRNALIDQEIRGDKANRSGTNDNHVWPIFSSHGVP